MLTPEQRAKVKSPRETREYLWAEIDRLRAENEALREAGEGLAEALRLLRAHTPLLAYGEPAETVRAAHARWREVVS